MSVALICSNCSRAFAGLWIRSSAANPLKLRIFITEGVDYSCLNLWLFSLNFVYWSAWHLARGKFYTCRLQNLSIMTIPSISSIAPWSYWSFCIFVLSYQQFQSWTMVLEVQLDLFIRHLAAALMFRYVESFGIGRFTLLKPAWLGQLFYSRAIGSWTIPVCHHLSSSKPVASHSYYSLSSFIFIIYR